MEKEEEIWKKYGGRNFFHTPFEIRTFPISRKVTKLRKFASYTAIFVAIVKKMAGIVLK